MTDLPEVGDFARVVAACPCGGNSDCLGDIVLVKELTGLHDAYCECSTCGHQYHGRVVMAFGEKAGVGYPHSWLRKVSAPRQLLEEIEQQVVPA